MYSKQKTSVNCINKYKSELTCYSSCEKKNIDKEYIEYLNEPFVKYTERCIKSTTDIYGGECAKSWCKIPISKGLNSIGTKWIDILLKFIEPHLTNIVSIGSGDGYVENEIQKNYNFEVFGIEPYINKFSNHPLKTNIPAHSKKFKEYNTLDMLPNIEWNDTCMFINWPYNEGMNNPDSYDYNSVISKKPAWVITILDTTGSSGSEKFITWLYSSGLNPVRIFGDYNSPEENIDTDYIVETSFLQCIHNFDIDYEYDTFLGTYDIYAVLLRRKDIKKIDNVPEKIIFNNKKQQNLI